MASIGQVMSELRVAALAGSFDSVLEQLTANRERNRAVNAGKLGVEKNASDLPYDMAIRTLQAIPSGNTESESSSELSRVVESIVDSLNLLRQRITSAPEIRTASQ